MPGTGVRTGARILVDVGDGSSFPSAAHLAASAQLGRFVWISRSLVWACR
ncbi:transposase [Streptomyces phaeogriseichromatogenes]|nr:transposase [Streptomyces murinus]